MKWNKWRGLIEKTNRPSARKVFLFVSWIIDWTGQSHGILPLKPANTDCSDAGFYTSTTSVIAMLFIGCVLDCSSVICVNGLCDIISQIISPNKAQPRSVWGGWTMLSSFAGCLWSSFRPWCVCVLACVSVSLCVCVSVSVCVWETEEEEGCFSG